MQLAIAGLMKFLGVTLAASCLYSPLAWSPDGRWLAYTLSEAPLDSKPAPRWLFSPAFSDQASPTARPAARLDQVLAGRTYQIWVSGREPLEKVLIEQSAWPLSAPSWGPDGHRLAYLRFRVDPGLESGASLHGAAELVVQDSLEQKRAVFTLSELDLTPADVDNFVAAQPLWSPDGETLAIARPGAEPAILIVAPGEQRPRKILVGAKLASWSPDGIRLAAIVPTHDPSSESQIQILGPDFSLIRTIPGFGDVHEAPCWSSDGQSILFAARRFLARNRGIELVRAQVDSGRSTPILPIIAQPGLRAQRPALATGPRIQFPGASRVSFSLDREQDLCVFATQFPGQDHVVGYCNVRQPQTYKRFPAIDISLGIGTLSMHPDGQVVALRVEGLDGAAPVLLCEIGSEQVTLLAPDARARVQWMRTLERAARGLLSMSLPAANRDGIPVHRPTLLPVAGEISLHSPVHPRLRRLGRTGRSLFNAIGGDESGAIESRDSGVTADEYRLFFDYLAGEFHVAEADLEALESMADSDHQRLMLSAARAQILHAQGHAERALPMVEYLLQQRGQSRNVERTALGAVESQVYDPAREWLNYLSKCMAQPIEDANNTPRVSDEDEDDEIDLRIPALRPGLQPLIPGQPHRMPTPRELRRLFDPANGLPFDPMLPGRMRDAFPPLPPRPFQPGAPLLPRFQRPAPPN